MFDTNVTKLALPSDLYIAKLPYISIIYVK
jgi:hypothetical protein